ncbi:MAG: hypothetical protein ABIL58_00355 [Pseudomonadota bacterium]
MNSLLYYNGLVAGILPLLPRGPRLGVIGGSAFVDSRSPAFCEAIGRRLAVFEGLVVLTGGVSGVGESVSAGFFEGCTAADKKPSLCHILPEGVKSLSRGITLNAGTSMKARREVLGRLAAVYLAVEGGSGTAHEIRIAASQGAAVVAVGAYGGAADRARTGMRCPKGVNPLDWDRIANPVLDNDTILDACERILRALLTPVMR